MHYSVAVVNEKGGVGKTTTAINVAGALSAEGVEVLFIDLDAQGNATTALGSDSAYTDDSLSMYDLLTDVGKQSAVSRVIRSHEEFDVLPSHVQMFDAQSELQTAMRGRERMWMLFEEIDAKYEFVIVDTPPSLSLLTDNALLACRRVLIPALAEASSKHAIDILLDHFAAIEQGYGVSIDNLGFIVNKIEVDGEANRLVKWFQSEFDTDSNVWNIRNRVTLKRAWAEGNSIFDYKEDSDMSEQYTEIATHLRQYKASFSQNSL
ncbi:MAG: ATPase involved in chromosome partitioning [Haloquadratum sp. J07HQX50]|nr:MAG: ATPase involved in chromosome partitioning [Haloquadratum sp. J07HQX50]